MKKLWMCAFLIPMFSFAAIEEEWLQASTEPVELTQEDKAVKPRSQIIRKYKRSEVKAKAKGLSQAPEKGKEKKNLKRLIAQKKKQAIQQEPTVKNQEQPNRKKQSRYCFLEEDEAFSETTDASESN